MLVRYGSAKKNMEYSTKQSILDSIPKPIISKMTSTSISEAEAKDKYFKWLDRRAEDFSRPLGKDEDQKPILRDDSTLIGSKSVIRSCIHAAVVTTDGCCYFTGDAIAWERLGKKECDELDAPSVDHDRDLPGNLEYRITTIRTNRSKQDMTVQEWLYLTDRVRKHLIP